MTTGADGASGLGSDDVGLDGIPEAAADLADASGAPDVLELARLELAERTEDLNRLAAEYSNYRKRVERDRDLARSEGVLSVISALLPMLDDVALARTHGDLQGSLRSVGEGLEAAVQRFGITAFGVVGDAFDPSVHEAVSSVDSAAVQLPTVGAVWQPGYRLGERIVRPARVQVHMPTSDQQMRGETAAGGSSDSATGTGAQPSAPASREWQA